MYMKKFILLIIALILSTSSVFSVVEKTDASVEYINQYYEKALAEFQKQKYEASLNYIRHVIKSDMKNYKLRYLAAHNHWRSKNFDSATIHFQVAINAKPLKIGTYIDLSLMQIHQKLYKNAKQTVINAITRFEKNKIEIPAKFYIILSRISFYQYQFKNALLYIQKAKEKFSANEGIKDQLEAILIEGRIYLAKGKFDQAEISLNWALTLKKKNPTAINLLGYIYEQWANATKENKKAEQLRVKAVKEYKLALNSKDIPDKLKKLIQTNLKRVE